MKLTQVSSTLRNTDVLKRVEAQLQKIHTLTLDVADKVNRIEGKVDVLVVNFDQVLKNAKEATTKLDRQEMPTKPVIFFGRDDLVTKVVGLLASLEAASHICLLGPGGMGKTSLALAIVGSPLVRAKFPKDRCVWVPCVEATSATFLLQVLYTSLRVKRQSESVMDDILYELNASHEPLLLLLDNFETPWNTTDGSKKQVDDVLYKLNQLHHVSILITMRGSRPPTNDVTWYSENIPPTNKDAARRICLEVNSNWTADDPHLDKLLDALGCMPFAVTLMAHLGNETLSLPKELLAEWQKTGTSMLSPPGTPENNMDRSICLSVDSNLVKNDPNALYLLATLSLLPAGTLRENLRYWAPSLESESRAISILSRAALLQITTNDNTATSQSLFVLPVVQSFMLHHNRIPEAVQQHMRSACCKYILDHACRYRDAAFGTQAEALTREDSNIQSILVGAGELSNSDDHLVQALLAFTWYRIDTKPIIAVAEHTLNVAKATGSNRYIAEALLCLGCSYSQIHDFDQAKRLLSESSQMFEALANDDDICRNFTFECAIALAYVHRYLPRSGSDITMAIITSVLSRTGSEDYWHARALFELGVLHWAFSKLDESVDVLTTARGILLRLGYRRDLAQLLIMLGQTLYHQSNDKAALEALQEAWEIAKPLVKSNLHGSIHMLSGLVFLRMGQPTDALHSFEQSLGAYQYAGGAAGAADALSAIGHTYVHLSAYSDAYRAYEAAADKYSTWGEDSGVGQRPEKRCRKNMDRIRRKQETPEEEIGFYRPRTDQDDGLFFP